LLVSLGFGSMGPFMPLYIQKMAGLDARQAAFWAGVVAGVNGIIMLLVSPIWGTLSDWFGHKRNVLRAAFATAGVMSFTGILTNIPQLLASRAVMGATSGVSPAIQGLTGAIVPRARLAVAIGLLQGIGSLGMTLGPLLGGYLVDLTSYRFGYGISGVLIGLGGMVVLLWVRQSFQKTPSSSHSMKGLVGEMRHLVTLPGVMLGLMLVSLVQLAPNLVSPVLPLFVKSLGNEQSVASVGLVFTIMGMAGTVAAFSSGVLISKLGLMQVFLIVGLLGALGAFLLWMADALAAVAAISLLLGLATGILVTAAITLVGSLAPSNRQGSAFGLVQSANAVGFGFGPMLGGLVASLLGLRTTFLMEGILFLGIALAALRWAWPQSRQPSSGTHA